MKNFDHSDESLEVVETIKKQRILAKGIIKWRKYTKRLVKKIPPHISLKQIQFLHQQERVYEIFSNPDFFPPHTAKFKTHSYISRSNNHNLKRLILQRKKFIKKYKKFNKELSRVFRFRPMSTTLTDPAGGQSSGDHRDSGNDMLIEDEQ